MRSATQIWLLLAALALTAFLIAVAAGSSHISANEVIRALFRSNDSIGSEIVNGLRLPRALRAFATGGLLAFAGALMQVLLRNPLADPYVLGLSGGSAVGALCAMLVGLGGIFISAAAFGGALLTVVFVYAFANDGLMRLHPGNAGEASPRLLLTGIIVAAGWSAAVTAILAIAPDGKLRGMLFWLMGDLSGNDSYGPALLALPVVVLATFPFARDMNVMLRGEDFAYALGVRVALVRRVVYVAASVATALAVTTAGTIGFVGLIVPHALRLAIGNDQRVLLPACALAGGALLLIADTIARTAFAPHQLPVGVITSLLGIPAFLILLRRKAVAS